ncbi:hypothetical protein LWC05_16475 [Acetobacter sicerae]|uniref:Uncharacterized protein n=1 Tax=Acetobacter sicerae TaxID=85325 RepID=A0ABS8VYS3_9PROT|nr:hypothetical protein [Acetobacter sicerae]MCE0745469.1 hypothetical protein [Acetobacter sicerae]
MTDDQKKMVSILQEALQHVKAGKVARIAIIRSPKGADGVITDVIGTETRMEAIGMIEVAKLACFREMKAV